MSCDFCYAKISVLVPKEITRSLLNFNEYIVNIVLPDRTVFAYIKCIHRQGTRKQRKFFKIWK